VTGPMFRGLGYPNWILGIELWQSSVVILMLWTLTSRYGVLGAPAAWLVAVGSSQLLSLMFARRVISHPLSGAIRPIAMVVLASLAGAGTIIALQQGGAGVLGLLMAGTAGACVTIIAIWLCDVTFDLGLRAHFTQVFPQLAGIVGFTVAAPSSTIR
jgi:O-antigen/teichoic acid export membrane protein